MTGSCVGQNECMQLSSAGTPIQTFPILTCLLFTEYKHYDKSHACAPKMNRTRCQTGGAWGHFQTVSKVVWVMKQNHCIREGEARFSNGFKYHSKCYLLVVTWWQSGPSQMVWSCSIIQSIWNRLKIGFGLFLGTCMLLLCSLRNSSLNFNGWLWQSLWFLGTFEEGGRVLRHFRMMSSDAFNQYMGA